jgi:hypothetical protein
VEVCRQLSPRKLAKTGEGDAEGRGDCAGDVDCGIGRKLRRWPVKVGPESREPVDGALSRRQR